MTSSSSGCSCPRHAMTADPTRAQCPQSRSGLIKSPIPVRQGASADRALASPRQGCPAFRWADAPVPSRAGRGPRTSRLRFPPLMSRRYPWKPKRSGQRQPLHDAPARKASHARRKTQGQGALRPPRQAREPPPQPRHHHHGRHLRPCLPRPCPPRPRRRSPCPLSPRQCSPAQCSPRQCSPRQCSPRQCSPAQCSPRQCSPPQCSPPQCSPRQCSPPQCSPRQCSPRQWRHRRHHRRSRPSHWPRRHKIIRPR